MSIVRSYRALAVLAGVILAAGIARAQWNPQAGQWGKTEPTDLRVMTWNILKSIDTDAQKTDALNSWNAVVRIVAAMKPDVLIMQEVGDGASVGQLQQVIELFVHGGNDPFNGNAPVTSYLQAFDPALDYPYVFVSTATDGFNRNVILSRYPFADLNNDVSNTATLSDIVVLPDLYAPGFNGGIRGYMFAEIDLPDDIYAGDVVVGNGHLKAFGACQDQQDREAAAKNVAYFIHYFFNGAGTGDPDPNNKIPFDDAETVILDPFTPVIWGGDLNQQLSGSGCFTKPPARWMTEAVSAGGVDGTDRDGSDSRIDNAAEPLTGNQSTQSSSKLDYLLWQDSIATSRREVIFNSNAMAQVGAPYPYPTSTFPPVPQIISSIASDHRPVIVDFILPLAPEPCPADLTGDSLVNSDDLTIVLGSFGVDAAGDLDGDADTDSDDLTILLGAFGTDC